MRMSICKVEDLNALGKAILGTKGKDILNPNSRDLNKAYRIGRISLISPGGKYFCEAYICENYPQVMGVRFADANLYDGHICHFEIINDGEKFHYSDDEPRTFCGEFIDNVVDPDTKLSEIDPKNEDWQKICQLLASGIWLKKEK